MWRQASTRWTTARSVRLLGASGRLATFDCFDGRRASEVDDFHSRHWSGAIPSWWVGLPWRYSVVSRHRSDCYRFGYLRNPRSKRSAGHAEVDKLLSVRGFRAWLVQSPILLIRGRAEQTPRRVDGVGVQTIWAGPRP